MRKFLLRDTEFSLDVVMTLPQILEEINRDRSEEWTCYDESDWVTGMTMWTNYRFLKEIEE